DDFSAAPLRVLYATYGFGDQRVDVTARLAAMVNGDRLQFQVSNASLGGDPAMGQHKQLRVVYLWRGIRYETSAPEGGTLAIP
ncbi:MAG: DNAJC11 domain-containing protein, partial [Candidatus Acidiferrales bacterium]